MPVPLPPGWATRARRRYAGPAFLQAPDTTIFVPGDWSVTFTPQGYGILSQEEPEVRPTDHRIPRDRPGHRAVALRQLRRGARERARQLQARLSGVGARPREIHRPVVEGDYTFAPDPEWCRILEFICPGCATLIEVEYLPPGHPVTHDIELDIDALKAKMRGGGARPMSSSVEIDIGGTFTDCYVRLEDREVWCKARTTPFDLSQGMSRAIDDAAVRLGLSKEELLSRAEILRYSTTLAMNKLIERKGPQTRNDHDRGVRGHRPDRPGEPVVGRDSVQGAAQHRRRR